MSGAEALTAAQRSYLEALLRENICELDVRSGGARQCISRLKRRGFVEYVSMPDWRDSYYRLTDKGREAAS